MGVTPALAGVTGESLLQGVICDYDTASSFSNQPSAFNARSYTVKTTIDRENISKDGTFVLSLKQNCSLR